MMRFLTAFCVWPAAPPYSSLMPQPTGRRSGPTAAQILGGEHGDDAGVDGLLWW
jgi:hypothetical protein